MKSEVMRRTLLQPREVFDREENSVSRLAECFDQFGEDARNLPGRFVGVLIVVAVLSIAIIWSLASCWKLTLVTLVTIPVLMAVMKCYNAICSCWEKLCSEADDDVGQLFHETFVNIRTVRCLMRENLSVRKMLTATDETRRLGFKRATYVGNVFGINFVDVLFVSTFVFWYGAFLVSNAEFVPTSVLQVLNILLLSFGKATSVFNYIPQINIAASVSPVSPRTRTKARPAPS